MDWVDQLLNLAGLLLWLGFRGAGFQRANTRLPTATMSPPPSGFRVSFGILLGLLLAVRAWLYWRAGMQLDWVPRLNLGVRVVPFNSAILSRMWVYSLASFAVAWWVWHCCLSYLSIVSHADRRRNVWAAGIAGQLGVYSRLPAPFKVLLPWVATAAVWYALHPALVAMEVAIPHEWPGTVWQQGAVFGAMSLLVWKFAVVPVLLLHLLQTYAYVGRGPFLDFVEQAARRTLRPFAWIPLRLGQIDLRPALLAALVFAGAWWGQLQLERLFQHLPL